MDITVTGNMLVDALGQLYKPRRSDFENEKDFEAAKRKYHQKRPEIADKIIQLIDKGLIAWHATQRLVESAGATTWQLEIGDQVLPGENIDQEALLNLAFHEDQINRFFKDNPRLHPRYAEFLYDDLMETYNAEGDNKKTRKLAKEYFELTGKNPLNFHFDETDKKPRTSRKDTAAKEAVQAKVKELKQANPGKEKAWFVEHPEIKKIYSDHGVNPSRRTINERHLKDFKIW